ncbi:MULTISPECIES: TylF/MycF/NovP-related O-methyltransferase [unclassified Methylobacterium]|uniref:TylF/MycF/NovP-related O-methyltransferase n=1 Tax=unclassified Methylobacterium TaxID=2615210 RepID=UPI000B2599B4|nr:MULTISPECIES: TylF/MycF/NovP-related O-methyltransferase [unclassified Methylobacterium]
MTAYDFDGLRTIHNHEFLDDADFKGAYARGVQAAGQDYKWYWRVHIGLWAARHASNLQGDFVECGVNRGFLSSAIMQMLDWDTTGRTFYLMDTFTGVDPRYVSDEERRSGVLERTQRERDAGFLVTGSQLAHANFADWRNVRIIEGAIPETLPQATPETIAFIHIDMNCSPPEVAALEYFWDRIVPGAPILLDDYAYYGYRTQKIAMDAFAAAKNITIASLPTGQGLMIKPESASQVAPPRRLERPSSKTDAPWCFACGSDRFRPVRPVLWDALIDEWQLSEHETHYVNRQQGECCADCGANLRSIALAKAIVATLGTQETLREFVASRAASRIRILELNEAGGLSQYLRKMPGYTFGAYPEVDMHALPYPDESFDLVVHSDTLEHIENPAHALRECARVLKPGGAICYTVPVIVGRLSRGRAGLPKSYHGNPAETGDDFVVHTEFGADFWTLPVEAGLSRVTIHTIGFPAATAISAAR